MWHIVLQMWHVQVKSMCIYFQSFLPHPAWIIRTSYCHRAVETVCCLCTQNASPTFPDLY